MKKRIWELDFLRGVCLLGMVIVHLLYNLVSLYSIVNWEYPALFTFIKNWGGVLFIVLSGICVVLGRRSVRRGLVVLGCGMLCTLATAGMYLLGMTDVGIVIYFGVLHCLGVCMLLWPLLRKCPTWLLTALGIACVAVGLWLRAGVRVDFPWLAPLGVIPWGFRSSDYFPLLPNLGYFLIGAVLGRTLYREKKTLFPKVNTDILIIRCFSACGRHSLWIYLLHQPVLISLINLYLLFV